MSQGQAYRAQQARRPPSDVALSLLEPESESFPLIPPSLLHPWATSHVEKAGQSDLRLSPSSRVLALASTGDVTLGSLPTALKGP